jgi:hypothetical protein
VFCIYRRTNSDLCHLQHKLIGFYNRDEKCLLRGTNWVFKYSSLRFVFVGLIGHEQRFGGLILSIYCKQTVDSFQTSDKFVVYEIRMYLKKQSGSVGTVFF